MAEYKDVTSLKKEIADFKRVVSSPNSDYLTGYICALSVTEGIIANLPNADVVEVVHGVWKMAVDEADYEYGTCSECGFREYDAFCTGRIPNYCSNCGAKMDGERKDER